MTGERAHEGAGEGISARIRAKIGAGRERRLPGRSRRVRNYQIILFRCCEPAASAERCGRVAVLEPPLPPPPTGSSETTCCVDAQTQLNGADWAAEPLRATLKSHVNHFLTDVFWPTARSNKVATVDCMGVCARVCVLATKNLRVPAGRPAI
jgi:hypothetical protein